MKFFKFVMTFAFLFAFVNCSNHDNKQNPTSYYMMNGTCYGNNGQPASQNLCANNGYYMNASGQCMNTMGQPVAVSYCSQMNSGYYYSNGQCYSSNGQVVSSTYCTQNTGGTGGYQQCIGTYYYCPYGIQGGISSCQQGYCDGTNCRGYTLYTQSGQQVVCQ